MKFQVKRVLVTGAKGFVGSNTARHFKRLGYETYGIGHGELSTKELLEYGLDHWMPSDITIDSMLSFNVEFDVVIHCGGSGSVGFSVENPYQDFKKTVDGTLEVLEFIRLYSPKAHLIYPSSPAVQGEHPDSPIEEDYIGKPCSPYGYHKKIAEDLCKSYSEKFGLKVTVIRLFSVYGIGLKKQLLWDAVQKINHAQSEAVFWGSGKETRDFIHIDDVVELFNRVLNQHESFVVLNGGTGKKKSVLEVLSMLSHIMGSSVSISFNNQVSTGNPIYYWASQNKIKNYYDLNYISLEEGLVDYVHWAAKQKN